MAIYNNRAIISLIVSISSGEGLSSGFSGSSMKPKVAYDPGAAPDVISVTVDTAGTKQETTKPLPEVANSGALFPLRVGEYFHSTR